MMQELIPRSARSDTKVLAASVLAFFLGFAAVVSFSRTQTEEGSAIALAAAPTSIKVPQGWTFANPANSRRPMQIQAEQVEASEVNQGRRGVLGAGAAAFGLAASKAKKAS